MSRLLTALSFLTRIPVTRLPFFKESDQAGITAATPLFPVVGVLIGALVGGAYLGLGQVLAPLPSAAVAVALGALATGAFHHDGLADMADAFGGGWTVEQRLEILKDSRLGTYGTTALVLVLIAEIVTIASLSGTDALWALVAAHALSRAIAVTLMGITAPATAGGLGADYATSVTPFQIGAALTIGVLVAAITLQLAALWAIALACIVAWLIRRLAIEKIGGFSGDVLGAVQQLTKIAILLAAAGVS